MYIPRGKIIVSYTGDDGKGHFEPTLSAATEDLPGGATIRRISNIDQIPTTLKFGHRDINVAVTNERGATFLECEMSPGQLSPMHTTPSIDFGVMISGEIWLLLDSGEERALG